LRELFKKIKALDTFVPIIISFNGFFRLQNDETPINALLRLIAIQFLEPLTADESVLVTCNKNALLKYISEKTVGMKVVLLIDELDVLGTPVDVEVSFFLKREFLDKANRYLVFTSRVPLNLDAKFDRYLGITTMPPSTRGFFSVLFGCCNSSTNVKCVCYSNSNRSCIM
jgi:hypothetical protein